MRAKDVAPLWLCEHKCGIVLPMHSEPILPNLQVLAGYWTGHVLEVNILVLLNVVGALLLGMLVGYERSYHGRAAGMRTYGLVCMASAALTVVSGYSTSWYGGTGAILTAGDPTRVIQGIVTGIGFLCAGVIMREGFNISGLTTAASLWATSVLGILVGLGFYAASFVLATLSAVSMMWISRLESWLPSRQAVAITLRFAPGFEPVEAALQRMANRRGYQIAGGTVHITRREGVHEWSFIAVAQSRATMEPISELAREMAAFQGVVGFDLSYARN